MGKDFQWELVGDGGKGGFPFGNDKKKGEGQGQQRRRLQVSPLRACALRSR